MKRAACSSNTPSPDIVSMPYDWPCSPSDCPHTAPKRS